MNRRDFLRNAAIITAGAIAADQLELLERLAPRRLYWPGFDFGQSPRYVATLSDWDRLLRTVYTEYDIPDLFPVQTPLARRLIRPIALAGGGYREVTYNIRLA